LGHRPALAIYTRGAFPQDWTSAQLFAAYTDRFGSRIAFRGLMTAESRFEGLRSPRKNPSPWRRSSVGLI
jgi:hypothetical protein